MEMEILEGAKEPQPLHYVKTFWYLKDGGYTKYFSKSISNSRFKSARYSSYLRLVN